MATAADVRDLLGGTSVPSELVDQLLEGAAATWLMGGPAGLLAADLALCHPPLGKDEVRAAVSELAGGAARLTIAAADRPGLLATVAAVLATHGLDVTAVQGTAWPERPLALLSLVVRAGPGGGPPSWDAVGETLRDAVRAGHDEPVSYQPAPPVEVTASPQDGGRSLITIEAPDHLGFLWAVARWFEAAGSNIEAAALESAAGRARGTLLVAGPPVDASGLAAALSGTATREHRRTSRGARVLARTGMAAGGVGAAIAWRARARAARRK